MKQLAEAIAIIGIVFCIGRCSNESKRLEMEHEQMWLDRGYRENPSWFGPDWIPGPPEDE